MLTLLLTSFAVSLAAPWLHRWARGASHWLLALLPAGLFLYFVRFAVTAQFAAVREAVPWVPGLGVNLSFVLDGLSLLFALLITSLGTLVVLYAGGYLAGHRDLGSFYCYLLLFMSSMLGLVLADNVIALFVFWELTSFTSYLLIGFDHQRVEARRFALQALLVTAGGGLALLAGLLLLSAVAGGSLELSTILAAGQPVREHPLYPAIFLLVALGAFTKSAQVPFHFWLPNAMVAPTPVSAYLHSATMVKAGIYLLARTETLLGGTPLWIWTLSICGSLTMITGAVLALRQVDLKRILAYSTITALGTLTLLLGLSFPESVVAVVVFILVHSLYKGALFLVAGAIDHETGTRDVLRLGGLRRAMPVTAAAAVLGGLSMAGLPPLFGFIGKELAYKAKLGIEEAAWLLPSVAVVTNAMTLVAAGVLVFRPFFGRPRATPRAPHEAPLVMWLGPALLGLAGLLFGLLPQLIAEPIVRGATVAMLGAPVPITLALWYGFNVALLLSVVTVAFGFAGYLLWDTLREGLARLDPLMRRGPERAYELAMEGLVGLAGRQTRVLQNGRLRLYLFFTLAFAVVLVAATGWRYDAFEAIPRLPRGAFYIWVLAALVAAAGVTVVFTRSRLFAVAALGVLGFGVALLYIVFGAPDLAMTQFLVETLTVVIIVLVMQRLPRLPEREPSSLASRARDGALALAAGGLVTALLLAVVARPLDTEVSDYLARESVPSGFGRNVVNVILVDFRALDTLGEILVIAVAALGGLALTRLRPPRAARPVEPAQSLILQTATRLLVLLLLTLSASLLWQGHNLPGGGFVGGLVAAGAFSLYMLAFGAEESRRLLRLHPRSLVAIGLALALGSGLVAAVSGEDFLTGQWIDLAIGAGEPVKLGTPLLFDLGVYLVVIGFTLAFAFSLGRTQTDTDEAISIPREGEPIPREGEQQGPSSGGEA
jgi:multicomponent Na+:H+ antiporter subunit A